MKKWLFIIIAVLAVALGFVINAYNNANEKWETAMGNIKAYDLQLSDAKGKCAALKLTVDQLEYFQDSILRKLDDTRKELKIKDSKLQALQYVASTFTKRDTITLRDTLFKEPTLAMDTLIGDQWYSVRLGLKYPSTIAVQPEFKSEKHIIVSHKKETVNPPKKFFLFRWLQKKHTVLHVDVVEKNPYVDDETSRYVEIIR